MSQTSAVHTIPPEELLQVFAFSQSTWHFAPPQVMWL